MKQILLSQDKFALLDDQDYDILMKWKWYAAKIGFTFYARRKTSRKNPPRKTICMHQTIAERMGILGEVDHIDRNGLNNQRDNLRLATDSQNSAHRRKYKNNTSGYKGVSQFKHGSKWRAQIQVDNKFISLGFFDTKIDAAKAYNEAALKYFGEFATLNEIKDE